MSLRDRLDRNPFLFWDYVDLHTACEGSPWSPWVTQAPCPSFIHRETRNRISVYLHNELRANEAIAVVRRELGIDPNAVAPPKNTADYWAGRVIGTMCGGRRFHPDVDRYRIEIVMREFAESIRRERDA